MNIRDAIIKVLNAHSFVLEEGDNKIMWAEPEEIELYANEILALIDS